MSISKIFIPNFVCVFSQIKDRKHNEQNFHAVAKVMPRGGTAGAGRVKNFSLGICDGAPSTARSSFICYSHSDCCHGIINIVFLYYHFMM